MNNDIFCGVSSELADVRQLLREVMSADELPADESLKSSLESQGKLLRAGLLLLISKNGQKANSSRVAKLGCAVEMLHLATLLHDDVIDRACARRRRPTVARLFGDKGSILLGDFLFAKCLRKLAESQEFEALAQLAGAVELCAEGELTEQANLFNLSLTVDQYMSIINRKTAELFAASCRIGSSLHGHNGADSDALSEFGRLFGQGFQIVDDLLDFTSDDEPMGKPCGQDLSHGVITLPVILALEASGDDSEVRESPFRSRRLLASDNVESWLEEESRIRKLVLKGDALSATLDAAMGSFGKAQRCISALDRGDGLADNLAALCEMMIERGEQSLLEFKRTGEELGNQSGGLGR